MASLRVRVLGGFSVDVDGRPLADAAWRRNRARALVKLLAIAPGQRLHREQLMDALWPDLEPEVAAANLRKALHFARAALGAEHLPARGPQIALAGEPLWIDAAAFEAEVKAGRGDAALELYAGELLPEDRFESWADEPRDRLRALAQRALLSRASDLEGRGDLALSAELLERLVADDPLDEAAQVALIRVRMLSGERHLALRQYRALEGLLRDELDVAPSEAARQLYASLAAGSDDEARASPASRAARVSAADAGPDVRKIATVVSADVALELADPARAQSRLDAWSALARKRLGASGAMVERAPGGAIVAVFGLPLVREDDAERALQGALALVAAEPRSRVGVATGDVIAPMSPDARAGPARGVTVRDAGRLREQARPGSIVVGERTALAVGNRFRFEPPDDRSEGIAGRRLLGTVGHGPESVARLDPRLVGRAAELATTLTAVGAAFELGAPRLVVLAGVAGVGKSRLAREVISSIRTRADRPATFVARCQPGVRSGPYGPLGDILRAACGIAVSDRRAAMEGTLRRCLDQLLPEAPPEEREATLHALGTSAGIALENNPLDQRPPSEVAEALGVAWPRFVGAMAARAPTLLLFEDLHWASSELLDMLAHIVRRADGPLAVVATTRPEPRAWRPDVSAEERASTISLGPLDRGASRELLAEVIDPAVDATTRDALLARAEGNPLYIEQLALHLRSEGSGAIPDTLQSLLAARIDTLSVADRRVLQEAAVIGRVFWVGGVQAALHDARIEARLDALERRGFVVRRATSSLAGQAEFAFRHALLHDVVYESLPRARRARAHAAAGVWLENLAGERSNELADVLAHHFWSAIEPASDLAWPDPAERLAVRSKAFEHLLRAGTAARQQFVPGRAVELHERARKVALDDRERRRALEALGQDAEAEFQGDTAAIHYREALKLARIAGDDGAVTRLIRRMAWQMASMPGAFRVSPDPGEPEALVAEALAGRPSDVERAWLLVTRGMIRRLYRGSEPFGQGERRDRTRIAERIEAAEAGGELGQRLGRPEIVRASRESLGVLYGIAGRYRAMVTLAERDVADIRPGDSRLQQADALRKLGMIRITVEAAFEDGLALGRRAHAIGGNGPPHQVMHNLSPILVALFHLGRWDELGEAVAEHMSAFRADPATECQAVRDGPAIGAAMLALRGRMDEARDLIGTLDPPLDDRSASAWQARAATAMGEPGIARAISESRALEGRMYGPQHAFALLEALSALVDLPAAGQFLAQARRAVDGNALLRPMIHRIEGEIAIASGDTVNARRQLRDSVDGFNRLGATVEAERSEALLNSLPMSP